MHITTPANVMNMAAQVDKQADHGGHYLLRMQRESSLALYQSRNVQPTLQQYEDAAAFITEQTGIDIDAAKMESILALYPQVRILIAQESICLLYTSPSPRD